MYVLDWYLIHVEASSLIYNLTVLRIETAVLIKKAIPRTKHSDSIIFKLI